MSETPTKSKSTLKINKGVTITPPAIGRIMMGHTESQTSKNDGETRVLPVRDDHFTVTTLVQNHDRSWRRHAIEKTLAENDKPITAIPVRLAYNDPGLTLTNQFVAFSTKGRPLCVGDGDKAKRLTDRGITPIDCPRNHACAFGKENRCKGMSRIYLQIEGQEDPLDVFVLRTTSHNTLDAIGGQLARLHGYTNGVLAGMPLLLQIVEKTSAQSMRTPFYFATLKLRPGMTLAKTLAAAKAWQEELSAANLDQEGMEEAMRAGLANSDFADVLEDAEEWQDDQDIAELATASLERQGMSCVDAFLSRVKGDAAPDGALAGDAGPAAPIATESVAQALGTVAAPTAAAPATAPVIAAVTVDTAVPPAAPAAPVVAKAPPAAARPTKAPPMPRARTVARPVRAPKMVS